MTDVVNTTNPNEIRKARFSEAYERALPDMAALPESELVTINLDIPTAATTTLGAWKEISALREQVKNLHDFDVSLFDKIETYALAAVHAHGMYIAASTPAFSLPELADKGSASRELLLSDAVALAKRGLIDGERLKELKGPQGYRNVAVDIIVLVALFRDRWAAIGSKTALSSDELDAAESLADDLMTAIGEREQAPVVAAAATDNRQRAFSLLVKSYDQARRAISYLRWNKEDIDSIAPSLYAGRVAAGRRKGTDISPTEPATTAVVPHQEPATAASPATTLPHSETNTAQVPAGFPGSDPFGK